MKMFFDMFAIQTIVDANRVLNKSGQQIKSICVYFDSNDKDEKVPPCGWNSMTFEYEDLQKN